MPGIAWTAWTAWAQRESQIGRLGPWDQSCKPQWRPSPIRDTMRMPAFLPATDPHSPLLMMILLPKPAIARITLPRYQWYVLCPRSCPACPACLGVVPHGRVKAKFRNRQITTLFGRGLRTFRHCFRGPLTFPYVRLSTQAKTIAIQS